MKHLCADQTYQVSAAAIKEDATIYTLGVGGATLASHGLVTTTAGLMISNPVVITTGAITTSLGLMALGAVAVAENTGYSDLQGWYKFYQDYKGLKNWFGI